MKPQSILLGVATALGLAKTTAAASTTTSALSNLPSEDPVIGQITNQGCFNSSLGLEMVDEDLDFNTDGACGKLCSDKGFDVGATSGSQQCWCGSEYPPKENIVDDSMCNYPCTGFADRACGGLDTWSVYNLGNKLAVHHHAPEEATTTSASSPSQTSSSSSSQTSTSIPVEESSNSKTIGIVVGVVVGVIIIGAGVGGILWYLRKKRNQEIEEEHRRNAAVNAFINGSNPPDSSHGSISMTDSRLDPVMANRRLSDGSIADNQDYSRKILRVTNA